MNMLIKELLHMAEIRFTDQGCMSPKLDAEVLLCYLLGRDKGYLFLHYGDDIDDKTCEEYFQLVDLRADGMPVQYITGKQEFMKLAFKVNEHVLIPRPETETLAERVLAEIEKRKKLFKGLGILDLCCGCGAIAISLAYYSKGEKIRVIASDISKEAIDIAIENAANIGVSDKVTFVQGDLFQPFHKDKKGRGKKLFDIIVSNPPYIRRDVLPTLMREVRDYEPSLALDGGLDGLDFYRRILAEAPAYLKQDGQLIMEIGHDQGDSVLDLIKRNPVYKKVELIKDLAGYDRIVLMSKSL